MVVNLSLIRGQKLMCSFDNPACSLSFIFYGIFLDFFLQVEKLGKDSLINCAKTSMSSKLIGGDSDFFANLVCFSPKILEFLWNLFMFLPN